MSSPTAINNNNQQQAPIPYNGSSKQRRDLLKNETDQLGRELPFDCGKMSQLRILKAACNYLRKDKHFGALRTLHDDSKYINGFLGCDEIFRNESLSGFIICFSKSGELVHVSDTSYEHLGIRSIDIIFTYDSVYDMVHEHDKHFFEELKTNFEEYKNGKKFSFYSLWFVSKIKRNERSLTEYKLIRVSGHYDTKTALFVATCEQILSVSNREILSNISADCFTSVHDKQLGFQEISFDAENLLGYDLSEDDFSTKSLYHLLAPESLKIVRDRHMQVLSEKNTKGYLDAVKILHKNGSYVDCLVNLYCDMKEQIYCKYQVIGKQKMQEYNEYVQRFKRDWSIYKFYENPANSRANTNCDFLDTSFSSLPVGTKFQETSDHSNFIAYESEIVYSQVMTRSPEAPASSPTNIMAVSTPRSHKRRLESETDEMEESFDISQFNYNKKIKTGEPNIHFKVEPMSMEQQQQATQSPMFDDPLGSESFGPSICFNEENFYFQRQEELSCFDLNEIIEISNIKENIEKEIFKLQASEDRSVYREGLKKKLSYNSCAMNQFQQQQQHQQLNYDAINSSGFCDNDEQIYQSLLEDTSLFESLQAIY